MGGKKIIVVLSNGIGGAEKVSLTIAKALYRNGYKIKIVSLGRSVGNINKIIPQYFEYEFIKIRNISDFATWRLYRLFKKERPHAVFTSLDYLWSRVSFAAHYADKNIKCIVRSNHELGKWLSINKTLGRISLKYISKAIMQTENMKLGFDAAFPKYKERFVVIENPLDTEYIECCISGALNPLDKEKINYVSVCRVVPVKRIEDLVSAFTMVKNIIRNSKLTIIGDVEADHVYYEKLKKLVKDNGVEDSVVFTGLQENPYRYVDNADCFVLSSSSEGYPNSLLEALYLGVPSVSTRCTPIVDKILSNERGYVINVGDVDEMGKAMVKALDLKINTAFRQDTAKDFLKLFVSN